MAEQIRIGTSGWVYKHWQGIFYPPDLKQEQWFGYYARFFDTVEINSTFYHLQNASVFEHWGQQAPEGFMYSICPIGNRRIRIHDDMNMILIGSCSIEPN